MGERPISCTSQSVIRSIATSFPFPSIPQNHIAEKVNRRQGMLIHDLYYHLTKKECAHYMTTDSSPVKSGCQRAQQMLSLPPGRPCESRAAPVSRTLQYWCSSWWLWHWLCQGSTRYPNRSVLKVHKSARGDSPKHPLEITTIKDTA